MPPSLDSRSTLWARCKIKITKDGWNLDEFKFLNQRPTLGRVSIKTVHNMIETKQKKGQRRSFAGDYRRTMRSGDKS